MKTRYKYGEILIRERKGRYYVYKLGSDGKETYVGPLETVVNTFVKLKEQGGVGEVFHSPTADPPGFEPG
ncbi:putative integrase, partial [Acidianus sp. RZ1]|uniref:putative integrase n=1 Tax=Acidianus sp. RZ1 TaxID=1540082 RepID=UPI0035300181